MAAENLRKKKVTQGRSPGSRDMWKQIELAAKNYVS